MATKTKYRHIRKDDQGVPFIEGTALKVREIIKERQAYGWSPEEIYRNHSSLSLGQIYSALSYYWDHTDEIDHEIRDELEDVQALKSEIEDPTWMQHLRDQKTAK